MKLENIHLELQLEELKHIQNGLNSVIDKSKKHKDSDVLEMSDFKKCALGTFVRPLNFYTWDVVTEELFGFTMCCTTSGIEFNKARKSLNKTQILVNLLFVNKDDGEPSGNFVTVGEWRKAALKVQKKLDKKVLKLQSKMDE